MSDSTTPEFTELKNQVAELVALNELLLAELFRQADRIAQLEHQHRTTPMPAKHFLPDPTRLRMIEALRKAGGTPPSVG